MVRGVCVCVLCLSIMMLRNFSGLFGVSYLSLFDGFCSKPEEVCMIT